MDLTKEIIGKNYFFHHSINKNPESNIFNLHMHDAFEILFFIKGNAKIYIEDRLYTLDSFDLCFIYPGRFHRVIPNPDQQYERKVIRFDYSFARQFDPNDCLLNGYSP